jgi:dienelactone hydrolase
VDFYHWWKNYALQKLGRMRKSISVFFYCLTLLTIGFTQTKAQQVFKTTVPSVIAYYEYVPQDYNTNTNKYPIVIFLHGIGERGPNSTDTTILKGSIINVAKHGPPMYVKNGTQFPFILISPQLKSNYGDWPSTYVMEVINYCKTYLRIDERRIYLTGLSLGGGGTWWTAQDYPEFFAAIAPVCGSRNSTSKACALAAEDLPVWAFHGDIDTTVPMSRSQNMVNAINACVPAPSPLAKLTIYTGVSHNAWDYAYKTDNSLHNPNVYQWMTSFTNTYNKGNAIPVANAGVDKAVTTSSTTLAGSGTDADGSIAAYSWTKLSGPSVTLGNTSVASLSLSGLLTGDYFFRLTVTDNSGNTDSDYIKLTVNLAAKNASPVCNAGVDQTITRPSSSITATGTASDQDGTIVSYKWSKLSGPNAVLANTTTPTFTASSLVLGTYVFRLTVTDNIGAKKSDDMQVIVNNAAPVVNAGTDKLVKLPTTSATLIGSATDADGTISSYSWTKVSGASCSMTGTTTNTLKLGSLASGTYVFRLASTDDLGATGYDDITVTIDAPPTVNAGADKAIILPTTPVVLNGSATDVDGTIVKYQWSKYSGPNFVGSNSSSSSYTLNTLYEGTYVFKLAVTDDLGAQGIDYVTVTVTAGTAPTGLLFTEPANAMDQSIQLANSETKQLFIGSFGNDINELIADSFLAFGAVYTGRQQNEKILGHQQTVLSPRNFIRRGKASQKDTRSA